MKVPRRVLPLVVLAVFAGGVWVFRQAGVWRERGRLLPPAELGPANAPGPAPGGLPM